MPKYYGCPCEGCGRPLALTDDIVVCPDCGAPYHRECYEKLGRCIHTPAHGAGYEWTFPYKDDALRTCPSCGERTLRTEERCRCCGAVLPPESQCPEPPMLHPYNFEVFRRRLAAAGMLSQADDFHKASGLWSVPESYRALP